jgi:hypothetical protein
MTTSSSRFGPVFRRLAAVAAAVVTGCLLLPLGAQAPASAATATPIQQYGPSRIPDRIVLTPANDLSTSQAVTWRTSTGVTTAQAEIRVASSAPYLKDFNIVKAVSSTTVPTDKGYNELFHTVNFTSLTPGTQYQYRVGDGTNFSEWQHFTTASATPDEFSFVYLGDVQNGIKQDASRVIRNAFRDRPDARIVLQAGDLIDKANDDTQWGEVFDAAGYSFGTQNFFAAPGNHEYEGEALSKQWQAQFAYPKNGPKSSPEINAVLDGTVHYSDYQGVRFISMNSNMSDQATLAVQTEWLDNTLKNNPNEWTVVYFHHPVFSLDEGRNNRSIREAWVPLFEKYNVDLVLQGHDHNYGRGNTAEAEKDNPASWDAELNYNGPVYAVSVVGSKMYSGAGPRIWTENNAHLRKLGGDIQLYQLIDVKQGQLRYESRTADGEYYDGLTIVKNEHGKAVTDDTAPQVIDPGTPQPCLGCTPNPDPGGEGPETPVGTVDYRVVGGLSSAAKPGVQLPAGSAFSEKRGHLFLGDQNGRTISEIDPGTDAVVRTMTLPENIRDLGIDDANDLLYVGQQNTNWVVVSTAEANYGQVVRGPFPFIQSNRSIDVDPINGFVYGAVPSRGVEVLNAVTGESIGVINGTAGAYYVAADPEGGRVTTSFFEDTPGAINIAAYDVKNSFARLWQQETRPNPRQLDVDSTNGLVYVGYTGTAAGTGGFSVHDVKTGKVLGDFADPKYGKDGYGISVDEKNQRVFVSNRDFRLNPPGSELKSVAVTISVRGKGVPPTTPTTPPTTEPSVPPTIPPTTEPTVPPTTEPATPPTGLDYTPTPLTAIPSSSDQAELDILPVGSAVDSSTGHLFVGNEMRPARVLEIDPSTDKVVATRTVPDGGNEGVRDVAIDAKKGELYVAYSASWVVLDLETNAVVRGPFAFSANVRGIDVDLDAGLIYGATRGTGYQVMSALTGAQVATIETPGAEWKSHGIAVDPTAQRLYVTNEAPYGTVGVRVYNTVDNSLISSLDYAAPDLRAVAVDPIAQRLYIAHSSSAFDASGVLVLNATDLTTIANYPRTAFGNKVYGISVDPSKGTVFVSARDRFPAGIVSLQRSR